MTATLRVTLSLAAAFTLLPAFPAHAAKTIEREFVYAAGRVRAIERDGRTEVLADHATREFTSGRPDLPWIGESVEIPVDQEVAAVEIVAIETAPLAEHATVPTAIVPKPGLAPIERTAPDPEYYARAGFQPREPVRLGTQGWQRERHLACLEVCPVRWDAVSGRLERVTRVRVRFVLRESASRPLRRERVAVESKAPPVRQPFFATQLPSLLGSPVSYVIITSDAMAAQFQRLADWKTQSGVPAVVRTTSLIRQEYPFGSDDAERIRMFIKDAYTRWGAQWILLGGDSDVIPVRYAYTTYFGSENIPSDLYYSCLDGNWNGDGDALYGEAFVPPSSPGDSCDFLPEVWVGRAPVTTSDQAKQFVDKTLQYVQTPVGDYENHLLFFAEVLFPQNWSQGQGFQSDGAQMVEDLLPTLHTNPAIKYARLYENYTHPSYEPGALPETRQTVLDSLDRGYNIAMHVGHGYINVMSCGDASVTSADVSALTNGNRLINFYAANCTSNAIDYSCLGEAMMQAPNGGAVTNIGSSRFDFPAAGQFFTREYIELLYRDSVTAVGEAQARQKIPFIGSSQQDGLNRWTMLTLLLLGDPELRIYTGLPRTLAVVHPASFTLGDSSITVNVKIGATPLYGARVTLYKAGDDYRSATTNGAGNATIVFRPGTTGSIALTVTAFDARPYRGTVNVTPAAIPVLADQTPTIDDDAIGGTFGDGNSTLNPGETIDLRVPLRNNGPVGAPAVSATISTTDPQVIITTASASYGAIAAGATVTSVAGFRLSAPMGVPDQHEYPFKLAIADGAGHSSVQTFQLTLAAPVLVHYRHDYTDNGDHDGRPDPGETVSGFVHLQNIGNSVAHQVTAKLRSLDGLATVTDSMAAWPDVAPGDEPVGDAFVFVPNSTSAKLELRVSDLYGLRFTQRIDLVFPVAPAAPAGLGFESQIKLTWTPVAAADLLGYNVYRSTNAGGPFTRQNPHPTGRTSYYLDAGLPPFSTYYYRVTAVDSSGNESSPSPVSQAYTSLSAHAIFPVPVGTTFVPSAVAVDHLYPDYALDIVAGGQVVYVLHPDGTAPIDADGAGTTHGDFSLRGQDFGAAPSIGDLNHDGTPEIVAPSWDSTRVYVFNTQGQIVPGWPAVLADPMWSSAAIGDLDHDGTKEVVVASNGRKLYAFRANGTEWRDGDSDPATQGVFKVLGDLYNYGTPALADLDGNGTTDIVYGSFDKKLYAWRPDGTNLPGFPITLAGRTTASVAIGLLDGPGDTELDIVVPSEVTGQAAGPESLYVFRANGARHPGFPVPVAANGGTQRIPSPALGDINGDGFTDIVIAGTNGGLYVFDHNGQIVAPFSGIRYSTFTTGATEASPIVADIDGNGGNDILIGDEGRFLSAFGSNGAMLPGFPIQMPAEVKSTPAACDCDGDGKTEIVIQGWDENLYVWDYDFPFSPGKQPPWPQFHHDAARTGLGTNPAFVGVEEPGTVRAAGTLDLAAPRPNPAWSHARVWYSAPASAAGARLDLAVYDLTGRRVRTLERTTASAGPRSVEWDLRDARGSAVSAGVYFLRLAVGAESRSRKLVVAN